MIDKGSSVDVLFYDAFKKMGHLDSKLQGRKTLLTGFAGDMTFSLGTIQLPTVARGVRQLTNFLEVDKKASFNAILRRPWLHAMKAVPSTYHQCIKFPSDKRIAVVYDSQQSSRKCYMGGYEHIKKANPVVLMIKDKLAEMKTVRSLDPSQRGPRKSMITQVSIDESDLKRCVGIRHDLDPAIREDLITFLKENKDSFAWSSANLRGISLEVTSHKLNVDPTYRSIKQKRCKLGPERAKAVNDEVDPLLKIESIREVKYHDWLTNPVVVKKKNGKWRVCIDFTDLKKACPKDSFPLPHIDRVVEATAGHEILSFMDALSGSNQILMHPDDQEKTALITDRGTYCYKVMPFGLKNAGATYQRLVNKMFADQLGKMMEVYIDDMLVKSAHKKTTSRN